jgi:hypothetical protein
MMTEAEYAQQANEQVWREINESIEWEQRARYLCDKKNWTRIRVSRFQDNYHAVDMRVWIADNVVGAHDSHGSVFVFEQESDAAMFALRWL